MEFRGVESGCLVEDAVCLPMMTINKAWLFDSRTPTTRPEGKRYTSKDELLQRIKTRFEKSKDLVVRACLEWHKNNYVVVDLVCFFAG